MKTRLSAVGIAIALLLGAVPALAQEGGPDPATVRVRIGPLMMNPTISLTNVGVDRNVYNDPPSKVPVEDFTFTVTPLSDFWLRAGRTWISASLNESINWYQKEASQRTANNTYKLGWFAPSAVMVFRIGGSYINAKERPGFEIDTRAARKEVKFSGSLDFHALSKTLIGVTASRKQTRFAEDAEFLGVNLRTSLSRVDLGYGLALTHQLTPLTSLALIATRSDATFEFSPERNTRSLDGLLRLTFDPAALMRGSASIGFTDFQPADPQLPGYRGFVGSVDLTYVLLGSTRFAVGGARNTQYSYDINQPYYIQTKIGGSVAQRLFGPFDVQVRGDIAYLDYRNRVGAIVRVPDRRDRVTTIGGGIGFHMGKDLRLSFNVDQNNRHTQVLDHAYEKFLVGASLTYGF